MRQAVVDKILVVLLEDMISHSLPRIHAIDKHLKLGEVLSEAEVDFFIRQLDRVHQCFELYNKDPQCRIIFSSIAHLMYKVIHRALNNEKRQRGNAAAMSHKIRKVPPPGIHASA